MQAASIKKPVRKTRFNIYELNLIVIFTGYPVVSFLPDILEVNSRVVTVPFRAVALLISVLTLFVSINSKKPKNGPRKILFSTWLPVVFYVLYILRIIANLAFGPDINYPLSTEEYLFFAIGVSFISMLSVTNVYNVDFTKVAKRIIYILFVVSAISIFNNKSILQDNIDSRLSANSAFNSIGYGHLGVTLSLLSVFFVEFKIRKLFYWLSIVLGVYIMLIAGSRSPIIAFIVCLLLLALVNRNKWVIGGLVSGVIVLVMSFTLFVGILKQINPVIVDRITALIMDKNKDENRALLYNDAIDDFLQNPVAGKHFLLTHGMGEGFYPHNLILESFMALGFIGGCFFIFIITRAAIISIRSSKKSYPFAWVGIIFVQHLVLAMASGSLWGSEYLWVLIMLLYRIAAYEYLPLKMTVAAQLKQHVNRFGEKQSAVMLDN